MNRKEHFAKIKGIQYNAFNVYQSMDPTRTLTLRNMLVSDVFRRFDELILVIKTAIINEDCFGLNPGLQVHQMTTPGARAFAFPRSADKVNKFMEWLRAQVKIGILEIKEYEQVGQAIETAWTNKYVYDSYKRGVLRAKAEMKKVGVAIPAEDFDWGLSASFSTPFHVDRVGLLYSRVYSDLKGITDAMDSQISKILSQGIADGDNPRLLARKLVAAINGSGMGELGITDSIGRFIPARRRAELLARTEVIRAHHQAMIQEYLNWGIEGVEIIAEVMTAGDNRVCDICEAVAKSGPYTLEQAMNLIPVHPQCRCIAVPHVKQTALKKSALSAELIDNF